MICTFCKWQQCFREVGVGMAETKHAQPSMWRPGVRNPGFRKRQMWPCRGCSVAVRSLFPKASVLHFRQYAFAPLSLC